MTDINNDGYNDVFYQYSWFPELAVYDNGKFETCLEIDDFEVLGVSVFPSGDEGGYFIDPDKGIVVDAMTDIHSGQSLTAKHRHTKLRARKRKVSGLKNLSVTKMIPVTIPKLTAMILFPRKPGMP